MKKFFVLLGLMALSLTACGTGGNLQVVNGVARRSASMNALNSTVALYSVEDDHVYCTGFFVTPTLVVTARHCIVDDDFPALAEKDRLEPELGLMDIAYGGYQADAIKYNSWVKDQGFNDPKPFKLRLVYMNNKTNENLSAGIHDIAVLTVIDKKDKNKNFFEIAKKDAFPGEKVYSVGMPIGLSWVMFEGNVARVNHYGGKRVGNYWINIMLAPGSSGGPVMDHHGHLIGLTSAGMFLGMGPESHFSFTVGGNNIAKQVVLAQKALKNKKK